MFERLLFRVLIASFAVIIVIPSVSAKNADIDNRDKTIEERLSCFSRHASQQGIEWDEVCSNVSKSINEDPQGIAEADSLDAMIERLHAAADDMLAQSVGNEPAATTVDEVYEKHNTLFDEQRSVDDVIEEQGIKNDFSASDDEDDPMDENVAYDPVEQEDVSDRKELPVPRKSAAKLYSTDAPGLFDEPEMMKDSARDSTEVNLRTHTFDVGYERYYYEYKEDSVDVKVKGWWDTVSAAYTYRPKEGDLLGFDWLNHYRLEGRYGSADLDYSSGSTGTSDDDPNYMYEARALLGRDFYPVDKVVVTPYGGFGFRFLVHDFGGKQSTTGQYTYDRTSHYYYLPVGLDYAYQMNNHWRIVGNGEFDIFLAGWQKSYLSDVPLPGYFDVKNDQEKGFGVRGSIKFIKTSPLIDFSIEPFVRFWHIEDSDVANAGLFDGMEPENTTLESGIRAGVQF